MNTLRMMTDDHAAASVSQTVINPGRSALRWLLVAGIVATLTPVHAEDFGAQARHLVDRMTLPEKITELHGIRDAEHARYVPGIPRLHIPPLWIANGPAGVGHAGAGVQPAATALPAPIALAATWDVATAERYGRIIGLEGRDLGNTLMEAPDVNIARTPLNGRTFEAFGEDPWLAGRIGVGVVRGIQSQGVIANVKHYVANNQETDRHRINEIISERALREIYLPAFKAAVQEGHVASLMGAYNKVNGTFSCENAKLLNKILKQEWGFQGFVTSDFGAVHSTVPSALAGLDLEMPTGKYFGAALEQAVKAGRVPVSVIDDKLIRRFRTMMQFGLFDQDRPTRASPAPIPAKADGKVAREIAEEGMVLLKNTGHLLPLDPFHAGSLAVIGPYAAHAKAGGGGSSHVVPLYTVNPVEGIRQRAHGAQVRFCDGGNIAEAVDLAGSADVAIVMVGDSEREGHDHSLRLVGNQDRLIEAVAATNPRTIVVLKTGSAVLMPWAGKVRAILEAWYPGEEDGNAVAAVLYGDAEPSGRLPLTFPKALADLPANTPAQYPGVDGLAHYSEGIFVGYRHYDARNIEPLFPFGYGLSYTTFALKNLSVTPSSLALAENSRQTIRVGLDVTNTGRRAGREVVELYVGLPATPAMPQPPRQLKGFRKILLQPGQTRHVQMTLDAQSISSWSEQRHRWEVPSGTCRIMVGTSSRDLPLQQSVELKAR